MTDTDRIHERIDAVDSKLGTIEVAVTKIAATCDVCRPMVLGNGGASIDKRVTVLETTSGMRTKWFIAKIALCSSVVAAVCGAVSAAVLRAWGG